MVKTDEALGIPLEMSFDCVNLNETMFRGRQLREPEDSQELFRNRQAG